MTDGSARYNDTVNLLESKDFKNYKTTLKSFKLFCIGYGKDSDKSALNAICRAGNDNNTSFRVGEG